MKRIVDWSCFGRASIHASSSHVAHSLTVKRNSRGLIIRIQTFDPAFHRAGTQYAIK